MVAGGGGGGSPLSEGHGSDTSLSNFSFALGPILKFVSILGHNFLISPFWDYHNEVTCPL